MSADTVMARLAAADPARGVQPESAAAEALLERLVVSPAGLGGGRVRARRRAVVLVLACLLGLALAAAALAAVGVIRLGAPAQPSGALANPHYGLGSLRPGTARVLAVATPDPAGGPPWGLRVLSTTRGVGCLEIGRLIDRSLGVLGRDGAFGNDGRFHPLPANGLAEGGQCANLDAHARLFYVVSNYGVQASGWWGPGSCVVRPPDAGPPPPGYVPPPLPPAGYCPAAELRDLHYGLLGPEAASLTYRLDGRLHTIRPAGPEGAYLIVTLHSHGPRFHGQRLIGGAFASMMPSPPSTPIVSISYRDGTVCRVATAHPRWPDGACAPPPGYVPVRARVPTPAEVAAPLHVQLVRRGRGRPTIRVSFTARVAVARASSSYELVEDTSSPAAVFVATQGDIRAGQTVSWLLPAPTPGVYSGEVLLGLRGAPPSPIYTYSAGPLVGHFRIRVP